MMGLWLALEIGFLVGAALLSLKGDWGIALFLLGLGIIAQNNRIECARKQREMIQRYGVRLNP